MSFKKSENKSNFDFEKSSALKKFIDEYLHINYIYTLWINFLCFIHCLTDQWY